MTNDALERIASIMRGFSLPWGIAGGWAIDLFAGAESRQHADVDVALLRRDQMELRTRLPSADAWKVVNHTLISWAADEVLELPLFEIHSAWPDGYRAEFLLNELDAENREWVFRRDARIRRALDDAFAMRGEIPYLAPEIVLLYKSKTPQSKDVADLHCALPLMSARQKKWLDDALGITAPDHAWRSLINSTDASRCESSASS